jgi:hypothetical protein
LEAPATKTRKHFCLCLFLLQLGGLVADYSAGCK